MFIAVRVDCWDCRRWSLINQFNIIFSQKLLLAEILHYQAAPPGGAAEFRKIARKQKSRRRKFV